MPEDVWGDAFSRKGRIVLTCDRHIFGKQSLYRVGAKAPTIYIGKERLGTVPAWFPQPCLHDVDSMLGQRGTSLFSALAKTTNVRTPAQDNCVTVESSEFGQPQPGLDCEQ